MTEFLHNYAQASKTALGFFWKAGWAFVLGYSISAMIQVFVPKAKLTQRMGAANFKSIGLSTLFGTVSSSCSFAALSAARSLFQKGAHFITVIAFMFASTNLVIELGILILIFLGWQFLVAEIIGGIILIIISSTLIKLTYPKTWIEQAKEHVKKFGENQQEYFDWKKRFYSKKGWYMVGNKFVMEWKMVWQEILIGFTIAGFMAVFVPDSFWSNIFIATDSSSMNFFILLENALVAPLVAAATFIGSMGNIPLATVLNSNGVLFAGIMGFIYSDLMVPPLVRINQKYYGWKVGLYIAGIMYVSIVITAIILHYIFSFLNILPESSKAVENVVQFKFDYTFWLNCLFMGFAGVLVYFQQQHKKSKADTKKTSKVKRKLSVKNIIVNLFIFVLLSGLGLLLLFNKF